MFNEVLTVVLIWVLSSAYSDDDVSVNAGFHVTDERRNVPDLIILPRGGSKISLIRLAPYQCYEN